MSLYEVECGPVTVTYEWKWGVHPGEDFKNNSRQLAPLSLQYPQVLQGTADMSMGWQVGTLQKP